MVLFNEYIAKFKNLPPMVVRPCKYPREGLQLELHGAYAQLGIDPLDVEDYPRLLELRDMLKQYLFESKNPFKDSLIGEFWTGAKYARNAYRSERPQIDSLIDFGVRQWSFVYGPVVVKNHRGPEPVKDQVILKLFLQQGEWRLDLDRFSCYLQERGIAVAHEKNSIKYLQCDMPTKLEKILSSVDPTVVLAAQRAAKNYLLKTSELQLLDRADKSNHEVLVDLAVHVDADLDSVARQIPIIVSQNEQLNSYKPLMSAFAQELEREIPQSANDGQAYVMTV